MPADRGERKRIGSRGGVACDPATSCIVAVRPVSGPRLLRSAAAWSGIVFRWKHIRH